MLFDSLLWRKACLQLGVVLLIFVISGPAVVYQATSSAVPTGGGGHRLRERVQSSAARNFLTGRKAQGHEQHSVVFAPHQRSIAELEEVLMRVSDPSSSEYGKHWSREEIGRWSRNETAVQGLLDYLHSLETAGQAKIEHRSLFDEYITVTGPISLWESVFATSFHEYVHEDWDRQKILRAKEYSLPLEVDDHVAAVFNVVHFPAKVHQTHKTKSAVDLPKKTNKVKIEDVDVPDNTVGYVTPALLRKFYGMGSRVGNNLTSQAVFASLAQSFSPADFSRFQSQFNLPSVPIASSIGDHAKHTACKLSIDACKEGNLNVQYISSIASKVPTTYYYSDKSWLDWIREVASMNKPPDVISISYASIEDEVDWVTKTVFASEVMKLGLQGVTVVVASGDDGATSVGVAAGKNNCGYYAMFPASVPYVTTVGGTWGPENGNTESACSVGAGATTTSGGGFSKYYDRPTWQTEVIADYFEEAPKAKPGFGTGRGYPDISALAESYLIVANNTLMKVSGTAGSVSVVAGMISLVNAARLKKGLSKLGFVNPLLYRYQRVFINDITSGSNKCLGKGCCNEGFFTEVGWDAVTGLGSLNFAQFFTTATTIDSHSKLPTVRPTFKPSFLVTSTPIFPAPTLTPTTLVPTTTPSNRIQTLFPVTTFSTKTPTDVRIANSVEYPTKQPSAASSSPTTSFPTERPAEWSSAPIIHPTIVPQLESTLYPTKSPTDESFTTPYPTMYPTARSSLPSTAPTAIPSAGPTFLPTTTFRPSQAPTRAFPTQPPSYRPTRIPTMWPTRRPTAKPTYRPSFGMLIPSQKPYILPTEGPTFRPTFANQDKMQLYASYQLAVSSSKDINLFLINLDVMKLFEQKTCEAMAINTVYCKCIANHCLTTPVKVASFFAMAEQVNSQSTDILVVANITVKVPLGAFPGYTNDAESIYTLLMTTMDATNIKSEIASSISTIDSSYQAAVSGVSLSEYTIQEIGSPSSRPSSPPKPAKHTKDVFGELWTKYPLETLVTSTVIGVLCIASCLITYCKARNSIVMTETSAPLQTDIEMSSLPLSASIVIGHYIDEMEGEAITRKYHAVSVAEVNENIVVEAQHVSPL